MVASPAFVTPLFFWQSRLRSGAALQAAVRRLAAEEDVVEHGGRARRLIRVEQAVGAVGIGEAVLELLTARAPHAVRAVLEEEVADRLAHVGGVADLIEAVLAVHLRARN